MTDNVELVVATLANTKSPSKAYDILFRIYHDVAKQKENLKKYASASFYKLLLEYVTKPNEKTLYISICLLLRFCSNSDYRRALLKLQLLDNLVTVLTSVGSSRMLHETVRILDILLQKENGRLETRKLLTLKIFEALNQILFTTAVSEAPVEQRVCFVTLRVLKNLLDEAFSNKNDGDDVLKERGISVQPLINTLLVNFVLDKYLNKTSQDQHFEMMLQIFIIIAEFRSPPFLSALAKNWNRLAQIIGTSKVYPTQIARLIHLLSTHNRFWIEMAKAGAIDALVYILSITSSSDHFEIFVVIQSLFLLCNKESFCRSKLHTLPIAFDMLLRLLAADNEQKTTNLPPDELLRANHQHRIIKVNKKLAVLILTSFIHDRITLKYLTINRFVPTLIHYMWKKMEVSEDVNSLWDLHNEKHRDHRSQHMDNEEFNQNDSMDGSDAMQTPDASASSSPVSSPQSSASSSPEYASSHEHVKGEDESGTYSPVYFISDDDEDNYADDEDTSTITWVLPKKTKDINSVNDEEPTKIQISQGAGSSKNDVEGMDIQTNENEDVRTNEPDVNMDDDMMDDSEDKYIVIDKDKKELRTLLKQMEMVDSQMNRSVWWTVADSEDMQIFEILLKLAQVKSKPVVYDLSSKKTWMCVLYYMIMHCFEHKKVKAAACLLNSIAKNPLFFGDLMKARFPLTMWRATATADKVYHECHVCRSSVAEHAQRGIECVTYGGGYGYQTLRSMLLKTPEPSKSSATLRYVFALPFVIGEIQKLEELLLRYDWLLVTLGCLGRTSGSPEIAEEAVFFLTKLAKRLDIVWNRPRNMCSGMCRKKTVIDGELVSFALDCGEVIVVEKKMLEKKSDYFSAMFRGGFNEAQMEIVPLPNISAPCLRMLLRILRADFCGCFLRELDMETVLELIVQCDRFVLSRLASDILVHVKNNLLRYSNCRQLYEWSIENKQLLLLQQHNIPSHVVRFLLTDNFNTYGERLKAYDNLFDYANTRASATEHMYEYLTERLQCKQSLSKSLIRHSVGAAAKRIKI